MPNKIAPITEKTISMFLDLISNVAGFDISEILKNETATYPNENLTDKELFYKYVDVLEKYLGKNKAFATLRMAGEKLAKDLMNNNKKEHWETLFYNSLNEFGYARKVIKEKKNAFVCDCVFYDILQLNGLDPTEHSICWIGWGFIESFIKEFENVKSIKWVSRDKDNNRCKFDFIKK